MGSGREKSDLKLGSEKGKMQRQVRTERCGDRVEQRDAAVILGVSPFPFSDYFPKIF